MTFREIRDHKFKILFMYYFMQTDLDQIFLNYFFNLPYEEEDDENTYVGVSKTHKNIAEIRISEDDKEGQNASDLAVTLTKDDNIRDIKRKVKEVIDRTSEIDSIISQNLESWDIKRVGKAELTIIRLAIYEMYFDAAVDIPVAINEAIELAKVYGDEKSDKFVNGVLATVYKKKSQ